jgi:hypothetical protein
MMWALKTIMHSNQTAFAPRWHFRRTRDVQLGV